jgi:GTP-binding protein Era
VAIVADTQAANVDEDEGDAIGPQGEGYRSGFVSILGNPNVGKSTLLNAILRQKLSIVSPKPQTTRHRILAVLTDPSYQLILSDTPGMLKPSYKLQEAMMDTVKGAAVDADVVVLVTDVFGETLADERILEGLQLTDRPVLVVVNKIDLVENLTASVLNVSVASAGAELTRLPSSRQVKERGSDALTALSLRRLEALWASRLPKAQVVGVSAALGFNVSELVTRLVGLLPAGPKYFPDDMLTNRDERFFAAEIVREAVFHLYRDELPYSCEVLIAAFNDKSPGLSVIEAEIIVSPLYCLLTWLY